MMAATDLISGGWISYFVNYTIRSSKIYIQSEIKMLRRFCNAIRHNVFYVFDKFGKFGITTTKCKILETLAGKTLSQRHMEIVGSVVE